MKVHDLKIEEKYFKEVLSGNKTFEIRKNDRDFRVGELVELSEVIQPSIYNEPCYTGRVLFKEITYITDFNQKDGYVVFGIKDVNND